MTLLKKRLSKDIATSSASTSPAPPPLSHEAKRVKSDDRERHAHEIYAHIMMLREHRHHDESAASASADDAMAHHPPPSPSLRPTRSSSLARSSPSRSSRWNQYYPQYPYAQAHLYAHHHPYYHPSPVSSMNIVTPRDFSPRDVLSQAARELEGSGAYQNGYAALSSIPDPRALPCPPFKKSGEPTSASSAEVPSMVRHMGTSRRVSTSSASSYMTSLSSRTTSSPRDLTNPLEMLSSVVCAATPTPPRSPPRSALVAATAAASLKDEKKSPRESDVALVQTTSTPRSPRSSDLDPKNTKESEESRYVGDRCPTTGLRHGRGIMRYSNGCRYVGLFHQDKRHGFGKVWYPNSMGEYTGEWKDNKRHGRFGTMKYANGDVYEGGWEDDVPHGVGSLKMNVSGEVYDGEFLKRKKHGRGRHVYANGDVYEGEWMEDVRHGPGVFRVKDGELLERRVYFRGTLMGQTTTSDGEQ